MDRERYQGLVGKPNYLFNTHPDIAFAVSVVSQFMRAPQGSHYEVVILVLRYLRLETGKGMFFKKHDHLQMEAYMDTDWAGFATNRRSTSRVLHFC